MTITPSDDDEDVFFSALNHNTIIHMKYIKYQNFRLF